MPSHRPYAKDPNSPPSVTQILDVLAKPGLPWAAARETAEFAVRHAENWSQDSPDKAVDRLRKHHRGVWDHRALVGTLVHAVNEAWALGESVQLGALIDQMQAESRLWQRKGADEIAEEVRPMLEGLAAAWRVLTPETLAVEDVIRYWDPAYPYVGSMDWRSIVSFRSRRLPTLIDLKTTGNVKAGTAHYWDSWRLQLAAYRFASETVTYDDSDQEIGTGPVVPVAATAILLVRANGEWEYLPVQAGKAEHEAFMDIRRTFAWLNGEGKAAGRELASA